MDDRAPEQRHLTNEPRTPRAQRLPEISVERPRCPRCSNFRLHKDRSISDQGDGSALWWVHCRNERCGHRFKVILE